MAISRGTPVSSPTIARVSESTLPASGLMRVASRPWLLICGVLLMQAIWILSVPPFRAIDEFDHAYRAASVAHGEWVAGDRAVNGRGDYVTVPEDLVRAAGPVCAWYPYTLEENCSPAEQVGDGEVLVASASARYHPALYWVVGWPSSAMEGSAFLYGTRVMAALLNSGLLLLALVLLRRATSSPWLAPSVLVCMTPSFLYMTTIGSPNGTETAAAVLLFAGLLVPGLDARAGVERLAVASMITGAVVLATVRTLGPLWVLMLVIASILVVGRAQWTAFVSRHRTGMTAAVTCTVVATLGAMAWSYSQRTSALNQERDSALFDNAWSGTLTRIPLWFLQSIAAAPTRDEPAPTVVYALGLVVMVGWFLITCRKASRRAWCILGCLAVAWVAVQVAFSLIGYRTLGAWWQGRYALPFLVSMPMAAAYFAARRGRAAVDRMAAALGVVCVVAMNATHAISIAQLEVGRSYLTSEVHWIRLPVWCLVLVAGAAAACLLWDVVRPQAERRASGTGVRPSAEAHS